MPEWHLDVPGAPDQTPGEALSSGADELLEDADDQRLAAQLLLDARDATVGDLRARLEAATPAERREELDRIRTAVGMPSTHVVEERQAFEHANRPRETQLRDANGRVQALCGEPGCSRFEPGPLGPGSFAWVDCKKWWCAEHRAGHEEDMKPYEGMKLRYSMSGLIEPVDEAEEAERRRAEREAESRRRQREASQAQRRRDSERLEVYERARAEQMRREHPRGLRPS